MRAPKDQGLFFAIFFSVTLPIVFFLWLFLPAHVKLGEEEEVAGAEPPKILTREDKIIESEAELDKAQEILDRLEKAEEKKKPNAPKSPAKKGAEGNVSAKKK